MRCLVRLLCHEEGAGHIMRLKKTKFETLYCFLRHLVPEVPHETKKHYKMRHIVRSPGARHLANMHGF